MGGANEKQLDQWVGIKGVQIGDGEACAAPIKPNMSPDLTLLRLHTKIYLIKD